MSEAANETKAASHPDLLWAEVIDFLDRNGIARSRTVAPAEFGDHLAGAVAYPDAAATDWNDISAVVIHQGWGPPPPPALPSRVPHMLLPGYANAVFAVYTRDAFATVTTPDHFRAFMEQIPQVDAMAPQPRAERFPPIAVHAGNGRMICRDPDFRKIIVPSASIRVLGALLEGQNIVSGLRELVRPLAANARMVVDNGAGIGLFAIACKDLLARDAVHLAIETEDTDIPALVANTELAGLFWRTMYMTSRPADFADIADGPKGENEKFLWAERKLKLDLSRRCDLLHIDAGFGLGEASGTLTHWLEANGWPNVIVSDGLAMRQAQTADGGGDVADALSSAGYRNTLDSAGGDGLYHLWGWRHPARSG